MQTQREQIDIMDTKTMQTERKKELEKDPNCYNYDHPLKKCKDTVLQ